MRKALPFTLFILATLFITVASLSYAEETENRSNTSDQPGVTTTQERKEVRFRTAKFMEDRQKRIDAFKEDLAALKDKRQSNILENINTALGRLNEKHTKMLKTVLGNFEKLLNRFEGKTDKLEADGKDVTDVRAKIAIARTAIADAYAAIETQIDKDYTITIHDDSTLREDARTMRDALKNDLKSVRETVVKARMAVREVAEALHTVTE